MKGNKYFEGGDVDDSSFDVGTDKLNIVGALAGLGDGDWIDADKVGALTMDNLRRLWTIALPAKMEVDTLYSVADGGTDTIAAPGAHSAIEVLGFNISESVNAACVCTTPAMLHFGSDILWYGIRMPEGTLNKNYRTVATNLRVQGSDNEALTLTNMDVSAGTTITYATIYYRIVDSLV